MEIVWACGTRTASEFLVKLTRAVAGEEFRPYAAITPGRIDSIDPSREPDLRKFMREERGADYFRHHGIRTAKIEEPGEDSLLSEVMTAYPELRCMTTLRRIEDVIISHYNIESWGRSESAVLKSWSAAIGVFELLSREGRLYVVDINRPSSFTVASMAAFLGVKPSADAVQWVSEWPVTNDLNYQKERSGERGGEKSYPADIATLRERHSWIDEIEQRYRRLSD